MDLIKANGKEYDIDTKEGAREYLEGEGFDVDALIDLGMVRINTWIKSINKLNQ